MLLTHPILNFDFDGRHNPIFNLHYENQIQIRKKLRVKALTILKRGLVENKPSGGIEITRIFFNANGKVTRELYNSDDGEIFLEFNYKYDNEGNLTHKTSKRFSEELFYENKLLIKRNINEYKKSKKSVIYNYDNGLLKNESIQEIYYDDFDKISFERKATIEYKYSSNLKLEKVLGNLIYGELYEEYKYTEKDDKFIITLIKRSLNKNRDWVYAQINFHFDKIFNLLEEEGWCQSNRYRYFNNGLISFSEYKGPGEHYKEHYFYSKS